MLWQIPCLNVSLQIEKTTFSLTFETINEKHHQYLNIIQSKYVLIWTTIWISLRSYKLEAGRYSIDIWWNSLTSTMEYCKEKKSQRPNCAKIRIFQTFQKNLSTIGIVPSSSMQPCPFNANISMNLTTIIIALIGSLVYIVNEAATFQEFTQCISVCSVFIFMAFALVIMMFYSGELFTIINDCESLINTSKKNNF